MGSHTNETKETQRKAKTWRERKNQPRVQPQWNPVELANKLLDDMEAKKKRSI